MHCSLGNWTKVVKALSETAPFFPLSPSGKDKSYQEFRKRPAQREWRTLMLNNKVRIIGVYFDNIRFLRIVDRI